MQLRQRQKIIGAVTLLAFLFFFLPQHFANAWDIASFSADAVGNIIKFGLNIVFDIVGNLVSIVAKALNVAVFVRPGANLLIVETTWKILRDFSNMFFIIMLIYMAFATIFDHGKYRFQDMIVRFLIVAILINFSLVIGNLVIDACQVLSNIFLGSIGNLGDRFGTYLNPSLLLPDTSQIRLLDQAGGSLISLVFALILSLIFLFSLLVALVFAIIRVPIIWALLIVSPLAWMSHVLPSSEGWWKKWWSQFMGWNLFLPVYLFFMYLGLLFLSKRGEIIDAVIQAQTASGTNPANVPLLASLGDSLSFNMIFFYLFAAFVMVGGTWAATKTTSMMISGGEDGFKKGLGWAKWAVKNTPMGKLGSLNNYEAAIGQRKEQFHREGVLGYFGSDKFDRRTTAIARRLGVRGAGKEFVSQIDKETNKLREDEKLGKIQINEDFKTAAAKEGNTSARGLAMRSLLYERGMIDEKEFAKDMSTWTESNPILAQSMAEKAKKGKYKSVAPTELLKMAMAEGQYSVFQNPASTVLRKDWFDFLKDNDKALGAMTVDQYGKAISLLGGPKTNDAAEYRKAIAKKRPDLVIDYDLKDSKFKKDPRVRAGWLLKEIKDKKATEIGQMSDKTWQDPDFVKALSLNMANLDKSDPPYKQDQEIPNSGGAKASKTNPGGGANRLASLRKSVVSTASAGKKLSVLAKIRPGEFGGEAADEAPEKSEEALKREADVKTKADADAYDTT